MKLQNINRILVALDANEISHHVLQAASSLALSLDAQLSSLFVEDINLIRLAELPVAREVVYGRHTKRQLTAADMDRHLNVQSQRLRRFVADIAQQYKLPIGFDVLRGDVAKEVCNAAQKTDLLVLGKNSLSICKHRRIGRTADSVLATADFSLLLVQDKDALNRPVNVLYSGSAASNNALRLGLMLAQPDTGKLNIIIPAADAQLTHQLLQQIQEISAPFGVKPVPSRLTANVPPFDAILAILSHTRRGTLILDSEQTLLDKNQIRDLLEKTDDALILTR